MLKRKKAGIRIAFMAAALLLLLCAAACTAPETARPPEESFGIIEDAARPTAQASQKTGEETLPTVGTENTPAPAETEAPAETGAPAETEAPARTEKPAEPTEAAAIAEDGLYTKKDDVALYIYTYGKLPDNFITKKEAGKLGWEGGSLEPYAPGCSIGGDRFGNYEGLLPDGEYTECDIDTMGARSRGAKRIVFSDEAVYYTDDHYESFERLY